MASRAFLLVFVTVGFAWVWGADQTRQSEILAARKTRFPVIAHPKSQSKARVARVMRVQELARTDLPGAALGGPKSVVQPTVVTVEMLPADAGIRLVAAPASPVREGGPGRTLIRIPRHSTSMAEALRPTGSFPIERLSLHDVGSLPVRR